MTFNFPNYIQENLILPQDSPILKPKSSTSSVHVISVSKDGAEMTEETVKAIVNNELPCFNGLIIGESAKLPK